MEQPSPNHSSLIEQVEASDQLDYRYSDFECLTYDKNTKKRKGTLSLVFKGYDTSQDKHVVLKFMDPDRLSTPYWYDAFNREVRLLEHISGKKRCLQLASGVSIFKWKLINPSNNQETAIPINYFVVDWMAHDVEEFFLNQHEFDAYEKLEIFRLMVLATQALHENDIAHRDLKPDNFRAHVYEGERIVAIIDFNTAAHTNDDHLKDFYGRPAGAPAYAGPETFLGLAGIRELSFKTDIYALGAMLYELFNLSLYAYARSSNGQFDYVLAALAIKIQPLNEDSEKLSLLRREIPLVCKGINPPAIDGPTSSLPPGLNQIISNMYQKMTSFDFDQRVESFAEILKCIDTSKRILSNHKFQELKRNQRQKKIDNKRAKILKREIRFQKFLSEGKDNA